MMLNSLSKNRKCHRTFLSIVYTLFNIEHSDRLELSIMRLRRIAFKNQLGYECLNMATQTRTGVNAFRRSAHIQLCYRHIIPTPRLELGWDLMSRTIRSRLHYPIMRRRQKTNALPVYTRTYIGRFPIKSWEHYRQNHECQP